MYAELFDLTGQKWTAGSLGGMVQTSVLFAPNCSYFLLISPWNFEIPYKGFGWVW